MCNQMSHEDRIFNAAVKLFAHKDITLDRAVTDAIRMWSKVLELVEDDARTMNVEDGAAIQRLVRTNKTLIRERDAAQKIVQERDKKLAELCSIVDGYDATCVTLKNERDALRLELSPKEDS